MEPSSQALKGYLGKVISGALRTRADKELIRAEIDVSRVNTLGNS